jgi:glucosamine-6-phosphate deaminase
MDVILHQYASAEALATAAAETLAQAIVQKPDLVMALPAGRTPILIYQHLIALSHARHIDWSRVRTFNLDEFAATGAQSSQPYERFMQNHLFVHVNASPANIQCLNGRAADLSAECARYERAIDEAGGLDVAVLGIGTNGHVGFNEPGQSLSARTHIAQLTDGSRAANAWLFDEQIDRVPARALSMGMATILLARRILLAATGSEKAAAIRSMRKGEVTTMLPASLLQLHPDVTVILDAHAAGGTPGTPSR